MSLYLLVVCGISAFICLLLLASPYWGPAVFSIMKKANIAGNILGGEKVTLDDNQIKIGCLCTKERIGEKITLHYHLSPLIDKFWGGVVRSVFQNILYVSLFIGPLIFSAIFLAGTGNLPDDISAVELGTSLTLGLIDYMVLMMVLQKSLWLCEQLNEYSSDIARTVKNAQ